MRWSVDNTPKLKAVDIISKIRNRLDDMPVSTYSPYEIMHALNDGLAMIWIALSEKFSTVTQRTTILPLKYSRDSKEGVAQLPDDFYRLVQLDEVDIHGDSKKYYAAEKPYIEGNYIYANGDSIKLVYDSMPPAVANEDDYVSLPPAMIIDLVEVCNQLIRGEYGNGIALAQAAAAKTSQRREYGRIRDTAHFGR